MGRTCATAPPCARGQEICLAWKEFDGGGDGCYPSAEKDAGHYRIGGTMRWCEIKARQ
jgi:hypothetical protein